MRRLRTWSNRQPDSVFDRQQNAAGALALVVMIVMPGLARLHGDGHQHVAQKLKGHFIVADHGMQWVARLLIEVQQVFHAHEVLAVHDADAPLLLQPRLKFIFLAITSKGKHSI